MGEQKAQPSGDSNSEMLYIGMVTIGVLGLWVRFLIPMTIGLMQAVFIGFGLRGLPWKKQLKSLVFTLANFALWNYLAVGLPMVISPNQFFGFLGTFAFEKIYDLIFTWDSFLKHGHFLPSMRWAYLIPKSWIDISVMVWAGLGVAVLFYGATAFLIHHRKKKDSAEGDSIGERADRDELNFFGKVLCFPLGLILKWGLLKPAHEGHEYALSIRTKNYGFLKRMVIELLLYSLLFASLLYSPSSNSDFWTLGEITLALPLTGMMVSFVLGLIPVYGDLVNQMVFQSPYEGSADSIRNPFRKPKVPEGFLLGNHSKGPYLLTERNLNHHVQIVAPSGGGKTNIIKNLISDRILKGHGVIFLDYKADFEVAEFIYQTAMQVQRENEVRIFSLSNREISVPYNPVSHGSAAELQSRLMNAFTWSTEIYYRSKAESALLKIFRGLTELRDLGNETITLKTLYDVLTKRGYARELAIELRELGGKASLPLEEIAAMLDRPSEAKELQGLITNLEKVIYSGAGELLTEDAGPHSFTIEEAIENGFITYFLMNSLSSKETATTVGKLLLQDLMGYVGRSYEKEAKDRKPITIIIDEFAEFAIPEFPSFLNRVRGAGINVVIAHQSRADLRAVSDDYQSKIEANTNTKIIAGATDPEDAQFYAQMIGTRTVTKTTEQVQEEGVFFRSDYKTGAKSVREVEEFIIHPNRIKKIIQGQALVISRTVDTGYGLVAVPRAANFDQLSIKRSHIELELKKTRQSYVHRSSPGLTLNIEADTPNDKKQGEAWD